MPGKEGWTTPVSQLNEADRYLLERIRQGDADAWTQLVDRYGGRLRAFARAKLNDRDDAEDLVQDTFIAFLQSLANFREEAGLETYLFAILRRKILNVYRGRARSVCLLQDMVTDGDESELDAAERVPAPDLTASTYARREEDRDLQRQALASALTTLIRDYQDNLNFRDLSVIEMLFFGRLRNREIARVAEVSENHVAILKHRAIKKIQEHMARLPGGRVATAAEPDDALLGDIWQEFRPSCLKRNTLGAYLLDTLDDAWREYVAFHLDTLGCTFCQANYADLKNETAEDPDRHLRDRILQSTVGFLRSQRQG